MGYISQKEFETIKWLPIAERFNQSINSSVFKYFDKQFLHYLNEVFVTIPESALSLRCSYHKLKKTIRKTNIGQNTLSLIDSSWWNIIPEEL